MVLIQLDIPDDVNMNLKRYCIDNGLDDKRIAIVMILEEKFNKRIIDGIRKLSGM